MIHLSCAYTILKTWLKSNTTPLTPLRNSQGLLTEHIALPGAGCLPLFLVNFAIKPGSGHRVD